MEDAMFVPTVTAQKARAARGIPSVCSAHPFVLEASLRHGLAHGGQGAQLAAQPVPLYRRIGERAAPLPELSAAGAQSPVEGRAVARP